MGLFKTSEKDVLAYLNKLSEEEKAALLEKAKAAAPTEEPETETKEGEDKPAETPAAESAPEGTDAAPAAAEGAESPAEESKPTEDKPGEVPPEAAQSPEAAAEPAQATPTPTAAPGVSAEALQALDAKYASQMTNISQQLEALSAFIESLKQRDAADKEGIGFQRAQASQKSGQESYEDVLYRTTGIDRRTK